MNLHGRKHANTHCSAAPLTAMQTLLTLAENPIFCSTTKQYRAACFIPWKIYLHCQRNHACMHPVPTPASHTDSPSWKPIGTLGGSQSSSALCSESKAA